MRTDEIVSAMIFGDGGASKIEELSTDGGSTDAGKVLVVGDNGKIAASDLTVYEGTIAIDKGLTANGAAADAKVVGDAIASLNGSLDTLIDVVPADTASGVIASFSDGANGIPVKNLTVNIEPIQSGSGDPSLDNVRPISGWTGAKITCNNETINIDWTNEAGTVYGGTLNVISGKLTLDRAKITFDGSQSVGVANWRPYEDSSAWLYAPSVTPGIKNSKDVENLICDKLKSISYNSGVFVGGVGISLVGSNAYAIAIRVPVANLTTTELINSWLAENPITVVYKLATPTETQIAPQEIRTLLGENNIWSDTGDVSVEYRADIKKYIDKVVATAISALS